MKNIIFVGTNNFAALILEKLINKKKIKHVITKNDTKKDRGQKIKPHPVKIIAEKYNVEYTTQENINSKESIELIKNIKPELIIIIEYGEKLEKEIINIPKNGIINIHPSILPKMRGPTPIQTAIINGYEKTGVSIIKINDKIDSGNILNIMECKITRNDTYTKLHKKLTKLAIKCIIKTLKELKLNKITEIKQDNTDATYTYKFNKDFYKINWNDTAMNIERKIKAFDGIKNLSSFIKGMEIKIISGKMIKKKTNATPGTILKISEKGMEIATKENIFKIKNIQFQGKKINNIKDVINSKKKLFYTNEKFE